MKFRRFLSGLLFGIGCALSFVAVLALLLPRVSNPQLRLVLGSFSMSSDNPAVQLINGAMRYALAQSWRVLLLGLLAAAVGACLLLHFTPKKRKPRPAVQPQAALNAAEPETDAAHSPQAPNPFAVGTYLDQLPLREPQTSVSMLVHAQPILERNRIDDPPPSPDPAPVYDFDPGHEDKESSEPYFSHCFERESKAIAAERAIPSQSGSSMLIRNVYAPSAQREEPSPIMRSEPAVSQSEPPSGPAASLSAAPAMPAFSPRIRSTMGRKKPRA